MYESSRHNLSGKQPDETMRSVLQALGLISLAGMVYTIMILAFRIGGIAPLNAFVYFLWFGCSAVCAYIMGRGHIIGAYTLALVTIVVTLFDMASGNANLGGASLGLLIIFIVAHYAQAEERARTE